MTAAPLCVPVAVAVPGVRRFAALACDACLARRLYLDFDYVFDSVLISGRCLFLVCASILAGLHAGKKGITNPTDVITPLASAYEVQNAEFYHHKCVSYLRYDQFVYTETMLARSDRNAW